MGLQAFILKWWQGVVCVHILFSVWCFFLAEIEQRGRIRGPRDFILKIVVTSVVLATVLTAAIFLLLYHLQGLTEVITFVHNNTLLIFC